MTAITISKSAKPPVQVGRWVRNGFRPVSDLQDILAELAGYSAFVRTKVVARHRGALSTGTIGSAIPDSASMGAERERAWFSWRTGPYAQLLLVRFTLARQNNGTPTNPYVRLRVRDASNTIVGDAFGRGGAASGATDKPDEMTVRATALVASESDTTIVSLPPDTDLFACLTEHDYARLQSFVVYEVSLAPDTDNGYPARAASLGSPVLADEREDATVMLRQLWLRGAAHLWNWWADDPDDARNTTSSTARNLIDDTSTTTTSAPGCRFRLNNRNRVSATTIPVVMKVRANDTDGLVRLVDSSGTTMLECEIDDGEGWYAVQGELPATDAKYLLHYLTNDDLTVYGVSLYQCDTFDEWSDAGASLGITIGAPTTADVSDTVEASIQIDIAGGTQTSLELAVTISYPDQSDPGAPTNVDLDGWTESVGWSYDTGADEYTATFTKASNDEGSSTLYFEIPVGAVADTVTIDAAVESTEVVTPATDTHDITVSEIVGFSAIPSATPDPVDNGTTLSVTVNTEAIGDHTNASFTVRCFCHPTQYSLTPTTQSLDGWSETGWSSVGNARINTFTKATLSDTDVHQIEFTLDVNGVGSVFIYTNNPSDGDPFTDQGTGDGDAILVGITPA